jgi:hypothetical protein
MHAATAATQFVLAQIDFMSSEVEGHSRPPREQPSSSDGILIVM